MGGGGGGGGDYIHVANKHVRDYVNLNKNDQKGFRPGGILSVYHIINPIYKLISKQTPS